MAFFAGWRREKLYMGEATLKNPGLHGHIF
jgi:hypothetical protein